MKWWASYFYTGTYSWYGQMWMDGVVDVDGNYAEGRVNGMPLTDLISIVCISGFACVAPNAYRNSSYITILPAKGSKRGTFIIV